MTADSSSLRKKLTFNVVGLAKFHEVATRERIHTTSRNGTISYEPPDVVVKGPRSRLYDVWCMGCIILQVAVWLVHGLEGQKEFMRYIYDIQRGQSSFWVSMNDVPQVNPKVTEMMESLSRILKEETKSPALEALLDIVKSKMLVVRLPPAETEADVQVPSRATANDFRLALETIQDKGQNDEKYWLGDPSSANRSTDTNQPEALGSMYVGSLAGNINVSIVSQAPSLSNLSHWCRLFESLERSQSKKPHQTHVNTTGIIGCTHLMNMKLPLVTNRV